MSKVLEIKRLSVLYANGRRALDEVSLVIEPGECFALVGESGCGKTTLARAALGILPANTKVTGSITVDGHEIISARPELLKKLRGLTVGFVAQDPFSACQPLMTVGDFIREAWRVHRLASPPNIAVELLGKLGLANIGRKLDQRPDQWSGGMLQRAGIAAAGAHWPKLIIADEPTSALDTESQITVLDALQKTRTAILLISHDLRLVEKYATRVAVMKNGRLVEFGMAREVFENPQNGYTKQLLAASNPQRHRLHQIEKTARVVLRAENLTHFYDSQTLFENLGFEIKEGEMVGLCGASGCGKSTLLRLLMRIEDQRAGEISFGDELTVTSESGRTLRRDGYILPIFQDSSASLDRRWAIWRSITEPLTAAHRARRFSKTERRRIAEEKLREVGLEHIDPETRPPQLSIGQCQRVAIARALTAEAKIIAADEPTASLDALSRERIMKLFAETVRRGTSVIIVSHDRQLLSRWCHRVLTLKDGRLEKNLEN